VETLSNPTPDQSHHPHLRPLCPYCRIDLPPRKPPTRRSSFKCPACGGRIYVEPTQPIYPTPYLDETQRQYVRFLWQLDRWIFALGSDEDYARKKQELALQFGCEPGVGDVIWGLMNESLVKTCHGEWDRRDVRALMDKFRDFERSQKKKP